MTPNSLCLRRKSLLEDESPFLVACRRRGRVALVVLTGHDFVEVRRLDLPESAPVARRRTFRRTLQQLATDYGVRDIVVEDDAFLGTLLACVGLRVRLMSRKMASAVLLGSADATLAELFRHVLDKCPKLLRFVTVLPATGEIAQTGRRGTLVLLATALGLAAISF